MKRYTVLWFPAAYGYPFNTDWWVMAWTVMLMRLLWCFFTYPKEVRIIDNITNTHYIWYV